MRFTTALAAAENSLSGFLEYRLSTATCLLYADHFPKVDSTSYVWQIPCFPSTAIVRTLCVAIQTFSRLVLSRLLSACFFTRRRSVLPRHLLWLSIFFWFFAILSIYSQRVARVFVCMVITFSRLGINRLRLPITHVVSWTRKTDPELETENWNTLHIFATLGPFAFIALSLTILRTWRFIT